LIWSSIKGWSILGTIGDIIAGKKPSQQFQYPLTNPNDPTLLLGLAGVASGNAGPLLGGKGSGTAAIPGGIAGIASDALRYKGHAYRFGGAPGTNGSNPWDCSSFVNWVVGHDEKMAIPGYGPGKYNGSVHGPPTGSWAAWPGLKRISRSQVGPGDIIVWLDHMGIAISNTEMISAQNPANATRIGPIDGGGNGPLLKMGRL
jgi:hypothetical protein